ncbi:ATP-binding cassette domain-containing protein [Gammaproteobacteria bacterium]|nr:ATP-binding cassette domain-containing protein [Gammaproteobacteria bacterium]
MSARGLGKAWRDGDRRVEILRTIDLDVLRGQLTLISGPSGSGKTTLLGLLGLLDTPDRGQLLWQGQAIDFSSTRSMSQRRAADIGFVFQQANLLGGRSLAANVALRGRYRGSHAHWQRSQALLERLGIEALSAQRVDRLSGGERQRIAIARALINQPSLLLADEPSGNLDRENGAVVMQLFREFADDGLAVVVVSHDESWARYADVQLRCADGMLSAASGPR